MLFARILRIILSIVGLVALLLGLAIWIMNIDLINIHMLFGLLVTLTLLVSSILALTTRALRIWGIIGVIYAIIIPVFGLSQFNILTGDLHWLIQTAHMLVGIGAIVLAGVMITRYIALKRPATASSALAARKEQLS